LVRFSEWAKVMGEEWKLWIPLVMGISRDGMENENKESKGTLNITEWYHRTLREARSLNSSATMIFSVSFPPHCYLLYVGNSVRKILTEFGLSIFEHN